MSLPQPDITSSPSAFTAVSTGIGSGVEKDKATNTGTGTGAILSTSFRATTQQKQEKLETEGVAPGVQGNGEKEEVKVKKGITAAPKIMTPLEARMLQSAEVFHLSSIPLLSSALFHLLLILFTKLKLDSHSNPSPNKISGEEVSSLMRNGLLLGMLGRGFVLLKRRMSGCIRRR